MIFYTLMDQYQNYMASKDNVGFPFYYDNLNSRSYNHISSEKFGKNGNAFVMNPKDALDKSFAGTGLWVTTRRISRSLQRISRHNNGINVESLYQDIFGEIGSFILSLPKHPTNFDHNTYCFVFPVIFYFSPCKVDTDAKTHDLESWEPHMPKATYKKFCHFREYMKNKGF
jgi:hypothetical protein